jgi:hypothetical protein
MSELVRILTTHLDALLTDTRAIVVALIAAYAARFLTQLKRAAEAAVVAEVSTPTTTDKGINDRLMHNHAAGILSDANAMVRPLFKLESDLLVKSGVIVTKKKRASVAPKGEP